MRIETTIAELEKTATLDVEAITPILQSLLELSSTGKPKKTAKLVKLGCMDRLVKIMAIWIDESAKMRAAARNARKSSARALQPGGGGQSTAQKDGDTGRDDSDNDDNDVNEEDEEEHPIISLCSAIISNLSGPTARVPVTKTFALPRGIQAVIREPDFADADVGWLTWPAGRCLAEFLIENSHWIRGKRVIDIGCGTALAGIACALAGASYMALTDFLPAIVANAWHNLYLNGLAEKQDAEGPSGYASAPNSACSVDAFFLDWNDIAAWHDAHVSLPPRPFPEHQSGESSRPAFIASADGRNLALLLHSFDVVVAGDVVYEPAHGELVPKALSFLLRNSPDAVCFSAAPAHSKRRPGIETFERCMKETGFGMDVSLKTSDEVVWEHEESTYACYTFRRRLEQVERL